MRWLSRYGLPSVRFSVLRPHLDTDGWREHKHQSDGGLVETSSDDHGICRFATLAKLNYAPVLAASLDVQCHRQPNNERIKSGIADVAVFFDKHPFIVQAMRERELTLQRFTCAGNGRL